MKRLTEAQEKKLERAMEPFFNSPCERVGMNTFDKDWRRVIRCVEVPTEMGNVQSLTLVGKLYGCSVFVDETIGAADIRIVTGKETKKITVRRVQEIEPEITDCSLPPLRWHR